MNRQYREPGHTLTGTGAPVKSWQSVAKSAGASGGMREAYGLRTRIRPIAEDSIAGAHSRASALDDRLVVSPGRSSGRRRARRRWRTLHDSLAAGEAGLRMALCR
jgi:hypothetical protein